MTQEKPRAKLNEIENLFVGAVGGALETSCQMPLLTWKFTRQEGRPLPRTISGWYRGLFAQTGSVAPITAVQVMVNGLLERVITGNRRELKDAERIFCSMGAGVVSAIFYSPADLVTIQQQKRSLGMSATASQVFQSHGARGIFRGFGACTVREGIYTCGYLGLAPVFTNYLKRTYVNSQNEVALYILGSISAALIAATITHPVDTVKTLVQADLDGKLYKNARDAFVKLYHQHGPRAFFKGYIARTMRLSGAFFVISFIREKTIQWKTDKQ